jgi:P pilus assembly chaperone PapD
VPPENDFNYNRKIPSGIGIDVNMLVNTCQKLIYRPNSIAKKSREVGSDLKWSLSNNKLKSENPSPYYITFYNFNIDGVEIDTQDYIKPHSYVVFDKVKFKKGKISWSVIEDYGGTSPKYIHQLKLN